MFRGKKGVKSTKSFIINLLLCTFAFRELPLKGDEVSSWCVGICKCEGVFFSLCKNKIKILIGHQKGQEGMHFPLKGEKILMNERE